MARKSDGGMTLEIARSAHLTGARDVRVEAMEAIENVMSCGR